MELNKVQGTGIKTFFSCHSQKLLYLTLQDRKQESMNFVMDNIDKLCITSQTFHYVQTFLYTPLNIKETGAIEIFYYYFYYYWQSAFGLSILKAPTFSLQSTNLITIVLIFTCTLHSSYMYGVCFNQLYLIYNTVTVLTKSNQKREICQAGHCFSDAAPHRFWRNWCVKPCHICDNSCFLIIFVKQSEDCSKLIRNKVDWILYACMYIYWQDYQNMDRNRLWYHHSFAFKLPYFPVRVINNQLHYAVEDPVLIRRPSWWLQSKAQYYFELKHYCVTSMSRKLTWSTFCFVLRFCTAN